MNRKKQKMTTRASLITVRGRHLTGSILAIDLLFLIVGILFVAYGIWTHGESVPRLVQLFDLDVERNFPSTYSALKILSASGLLLVVARGTRLAGERSGTWFALAIIFAFLSLDEFASLHERLIPIVHGMIGTERGMHQVWVIPYGILCIVLLVAIAGFLLRLPRRTRTMFLISGGVYVAGAIGMEVISSDVAFVSGRGTFQHVLLYSFEEYLEMLGMSLFIHALIGHLLDTNGRLDLSLRR